MPQRFSMALALMLATNFWAAAGELMSETGLARSGLTRPWFAQVEMDQGRTRLTDILMYEGALYAQTNSAMVHALDAETGKTLWSKRVGEAKHPSMPAEAKGNLLAVINGSRLYVLNRLTGELLYEKEIQDAPGAGPGLSTRRAFVPMVNGMVIAYRVEEETTRPKPAEKKTSGEDEMPAAAEGSAASAPIRVSKQHEPPLFCQSFGRALVAPLVTREFIGGEYVVWPTDRGYMNFGRIDHQFGESFVLKYRLQTGATVAARPAYLPPDPQVLGDPGVVFVASADGFIYAVEEENGTTKWRFSTGEPISQSPVVAENRLFVATDLGGMYCLDVKTGKNLWWAANVKQFVAAGKSRAYVIDRFGRLLVLNAANGARLDAITVGDSTIPLVNSDTDRIYLASRSGLIQCLREMEQTKPLLHDQVRKEAARAEALRAAQPEPEPEKPEKKVERKRSNASDEGAAAPGERSPKKGSKPSGKGASADDDAANNPFLEPGDDVFGGGNGVKGGKKKK